MRRILAFSLVVLSAFGDSAFGQKDKAPVVRVAAPVATPVASGPTTEYLAGWDRYQVAVG